MKRDTIEKLDERYRARTASVTISPGPVRKRKREPETMPAPALTPAPAEPGDLDDAEVDLANDAIDFLCRAARREVLRDPAERAAFLESGEGLRAAGIMKEGGEIDAHRIEVAVVDFRDRVAAEALNEQKKKEPHAAA